MKTLLPRGWVLGLLWLGAALSARATLVTPPTFTSISLPATATFGQTITISATAVANVSDNSDGNNWNTSDHLRILRINIDYLPPGGSWTDLVDWLPQWVSPNSVSTNLTLNTAGTWYVRFQAMDGRPWYSDVLTYQVVVSPPPGPVITSALSVSANQGQNISYQITATNSPTSYGASNLPAGLSVNPSTGAISGRLTASSSVTSSISATNSYGTDTKNLVWTITAAVITTNASVAPSAIVNGNSVTLTRNGTANFGIAWTENTIWLPGGSSQVLGNLGLGSMSYTPTAGLGTYSYQFRLVDNYSNYQDQWINFTVTALAPPTNFQSTLTGSTFVQLSWSAVSGATSYRVYRNGALIGSPTTTSFTDSTVTPGTAYTYTVEARDGYGNVSPVATLNVTTAASLEVFTPLP
ncbi:MAG: fibronectin type III domain-containing protein [Opitutaceae bacterium]|nr:fibronectin type III domain-containing protein [Opitutaceae bacterium]